MKKSFIASMFLGMAALVGSSPSLSLPNEDDIRGIQTLCGAGTVQSASVKGDLDAAIKNWKNASANVNIEVAKKNLTGALTQIKNDANLAPVYKIYIDCVRDTINQFLEDEKSKPKKISAIGRSSALLRSAFVSDDDIRKIGCDEAKQEALSELRGECIGGQIKIQKIDCPQILGSPRSYSATVDATCDPKTRS